MGDDVLDLRVHLLMLEPPLLGGADDGGGHRMGEVLLQAGREPEHLRLLPAAEGDDPGDRGAGAGEGAGLVEDDGVGGGDRLEEPAALDGDLPTARLPHGREDREGHCQLEGAGEVDHQHRQRPGKAAGQKIGEDAPAEGIGHQFIGDAGGLQLGARLQLFRLFDHPDDLVVPPLPRARISTRKTQPPSSTAVPA